MKLCPACSREYSDEAGACADDGVTLVHLDTSQAQGAQDLIGQVVDGRYRVERIVGRGGMGTVYACRHVVVGKAFAMKVLKTGVDRNEEVLQRFIREAQAANAVKSRHICEMTDFGQLPSGAFYVVMELLDGMSLTRALREQKLTRSDVRRVFIQIADTLQRAHDQHIIHRDLKPDNVVLVSDEGDPFFVKLVDFGIAKMLQSKASNLTETGVILGTPYYMSPEQARGDAVDHRSDIYALGVMMFRAFTGKLPFVADTAMGVLTRHLIEKPPMPSAIAEIDSVTERLILRCLEKLPIDRFQSMADVVEALRALADKEARPRKDTLSDRTARPRSQHATPTRVATPAARAQSQGSAPISQGPSPMIPPPLPAPVAAQPTTAAQPTAAQAPSQPALWPPAPSGPLPGAPPPLGMSPGPGFSAARFAAPIVPQPPVDAVARYDSLHGEAQTNRGVVSSRMSAHPPASRLRTWIALFAAFAAGGGVIALVLRVRAPADRSQGAAHALSNPTATATAIATPTATPTAAPTATATTAATATPKGAAPRFGTHVRAVSSALPATQPGQPLGHDDIRSPFGD